MLVLRFAVSHKTSVPRHCEIASNIAILSPKPVPPEQVTVSRISPESKRLQLLMTRVRRQCHRVLASILDLRLISGHTVSADTTCKTIGATRYAPLYVLQERIARRPNRDGSREP